MTGGTPSWTARLLLVAALAAVSVAAQQQNCDLADSVALSRCVRQLLLEQKPVVKEKADPLRIPDGQDGVLSFWDGVATGLSNYDVEDLQLTPTADRIAVDATIVFPNLGAEISARARKCKRIIFKVCGSISARPRVRIDRTVAKLKTNLQLSLKPDGTFSVTPSGTDIDITFSRPHVDANIKSKVARFFNRIFGDPASPWMERQALKYWAKEKSDLMQKMEQKLDEAIVRELAVSLQSLLHRSK